MPSAFEGLGIVIVEAQAAGLKCLVSDVVPHEADCGGVMYKSLFADKSSWVQTMSDMLDGKIHLEIIEEKLQNFSVQHMVNQMEEVFKC